MKKISFITVFIICTSLLFSCNFISGKRVEGQTAVNEKSNNGDELSKADLERLKWLIQALDVSHSGSSNILGTGGVLDTEEKQAMFLNVLSEKEYEHVFKDSLKEYVTFENDKKLINSDNAEIILKMAGAPVIKDMWRYLYENYSRHMESEDVFAMPMFAREGSEYYREFRDWTFIIGKNGKLTVRYKTYIPVNQKYIDEVEVRLHKNRESVFGGYSADYLISLPIEPEGSVSVLEEFDPESNWEEYKKPVDMGNSIDEYIFRLDGALYQMPFPLEELTSKGWKSSEELKKNEKKAEITLTKEGKKIYCIVWNSRKSADSKWYVVSLKTGFGEGISDVDFELFENRKRGDYAYGYGEHGIYGFGEPLYLGLGISVYAGDDNSIKGFNMRYAPKYTDRTKRLKEIATDIKDEISISETGKFELKRDISYKLCMYDEPVYVQVRSLDKIGWAWDFDIIYVKKGEEEKIIGYIEYGSDFTLNIDENNRALMEVVRLEDSPDDAPEVFIIVESES